MSQNHCRSSDIIANHNTNAKAITSDESESKKMGKGSWSVKEDGSLVQLVQTYGSSWKKISNFLVGRNGKQCRERFVNHLQPDIKKGEWSEEDDRQLQSLQFKFGNRWAFIATHMSGRSPCEVKNRFNSLKRRARKTDECQEKKVRMIR